MRLDSPTAITILATLISFGWAVQRGPPSYSTHQVEPRSTDDDGWFHLSLGVRMKRDESSVSPLEKRSRSPVSTSVILNRNHETGKLVWPRTFSEALTLATKSAPEMLRRSLQRRARRVMNVMITWYDGEDLLHPACFSDSDQWAPTDDSMVAAVTIEWPGKPPCGSFVRIQHGSDPDKYIVVRIVDTCGGCLRYSAHIDLTTGAFEKLYEQDVGMVEGLKAKVVPSPPGVDENWSQEVIDTYGPKVPLHIS